MPFRGGRNNSELHRTISELRAENRELQTEIRIVSAEKTKQDKLVDELQAAVDAQDSDMKEELLDLRHTERQLARELKLAHAAHIKQETQLQGQIAQLQERCSDLQKSKAAALTAAMTLLQRFLDGDKPRPKRDATSLSSPGCGGASPPDVSSETSDPKDDKDESMEDNPGALDSVAGPTDASLLLAAPCQAACDADSASRPAADQLEEPQGLPVSFPTEGGV